MYLLGGRGGWVDRGPPHTFIHTQFPPTHAIMLSYVLYGVLCTLCCLQTVPRILNLYEDITSLPNKEHVAKCRSVI